MKKRALMAAGPILLSLLACQKQLVRTAGASAAEPVAEAVSDVSPAKGPTEVPRIRLIKAADNPLWVSAEEVDALAKKFMSDRAALDKQRSLCGPQNMNLSIEYSTRREPVTREFREFAVACVAQQSAKEIMDTRDGGAPWGNDEY